MLILYPEIKPYERHRLAVSQLHELYIEESGNPDGIPVLYLHSGPGGGSDQNSRRYFDPEAFRIIVFDQRGAGRSTPHAELRENDTPSLINDIEAIRVYLNVDRWLLYGGAWGAALSLLYAEAYPEHVLGMILRGTFLCRRKDIQWLFQEGASRIFPDHWDDYTRPIPKDERKDYIQAYYKRLTGSDELARMGAAKAWSLWEAHCSTLRPSHDVVEHFLEPHMAFALARMEAHYFISRAFIDENQILNNIDALQDIPGIIVHGRYDMVSPLENAFELHQLWHQSELHIVRDAGHLSSEPSIVDALVRATRAMVKRFEADFL